MPELPDVEGFREVLAEHATGQCVERVDVADAGVLRGVTARQLDDALRGRCFARAQRHGKWLIAPTDGPTVLFHFGMTGSLQWLPAAGKTRGARGAAHRCAGAGSAAAPPSGAPTTRGRCRVMMPRN